MIMKVTINSYVQYVWDPDKLHKIYESCVECCKCINTQNVSECIQCRLSLTTRLFHLYNFLCFKTQPSILSTSPLSYRYLPYDIELLFSLKAQAIKRQYESWKYVYKASPSNVNMTRESRLHIIHSK